MVCGGCSVVHVWTRSSVHGRRPQQRRHRIPVCARVCVRVRAYVWSQCACVRECVRKCGPSVHVSVHVSVRTSACLSVYASVGVGVAVGLQQRERSSGSEHALCLQYIPTIYTTLVTAVVPRETVDPTPPNE